MRHNAAPNPRARQARVPALSVVLTRRLALR